MTKPMSDEQLLTAFEDASRAVASIPDESGRTAAFEKELARRGYVVVSQRQLDDDEERTTLDDDEERTTVRWIVVAVGLTIAGVVAMAVLFIIARLLGIHG